MSVEHPAENKVAGGNGGVERKTQDVREIEGCGALSTDHLQRMQKNREVQRLDAGKNGLEQRVVEIAVVDVCAHVNAADSRQFASAIQFVDSAIGKEHGKREQSEQPCWIFQVG